MRTAHVPALLLLLPLQHGAWAFSAAAGGPPRPAGGRFLAPGPQLLRSRGASRPLRPARRAESSEEAEVASGEEEQEVPFASDFDGAALGMTVLAIAEGAISMRNLGATGGLALGSIPVLLVAVAALRSLKSAAERGRLSGGTFKVLSLASLAAFAAVLANGCFDLCRILLLVTRGMGGLPAFFAVLMAVMAATSSYRAIKASYGTLAQEGLPKFKTGIRAGSAGLSLLAVGYAVTALHQLVWGSAMLLYSNIKLVGALRCFLLAACAHVCQTAAVAGPKRLSSPTYRTLNLALILDSVVCFSTVALLGMSSPAGVGAVAVVAALPGLALLTSASGWAVGKLYKPGQK